MPYFKGCVDKLWNEKETRIFFSVFCQASLRSSYTVVFVEGKTCPCLSSRWISNQETAEQKKKLSADSLKPLDCGRDLSDCCEQRSSVGHEGFRRWQPSSSGPSCIIVSFLSLCASQSESKGTCLALRVLVLSI